MKFYKPLILAILTIPAFLFGQIDCSENSFVDSLYEVNSTVFAFANKPNKDPLEPNETLEAEVFYPVNYDGVKPLIMLAYGGAFVTGEKEDMSFIAELYASRGYVAATFDYRLWNIYWGLFPNENDFVNIAFNAIDDMAQATNSVLAKWEEYNIDTTQVYLGGVSAGAITSLHLAMLDHNDSLSADFKTKYQSREHLYNFDKSKIKGVLNLSGALLDTALLSNDNIPVISYHGSKDDVVLIGYGPANGIINLYGSELIHEQMDHVGTLNYLHIVEGGGHSNIYQDEVYADQLDGFVKETGDFFMALICGSTYVSNNKIVSNPINTFPNPFENVVNWLPSNHRFRTVSIHDLYGRNVINKDLTEDDSSINLSELSTGIYILTLYDKDNNRFQQKITKL